MIDTTLSQKIAIFSVHLWELNKRHDVRRVDITTCFMRSTTNSMNKTPEYMANDTATDSTIELEITNGVLEETAPEPLQMDETKREMLQAFGEAYRGFGLSKQMGHIVALLLYSPQPLSLDEITEQLGMSKGPISQVTRRLNERNIIRKVWNPGSRKDYYEIQPEVFANAFRNFALLIHHNTEIARHLGNKIAESESEALLDKDLLLKRLSEMGTFYTLMEKHFTNFLEEWATTRPLLYANGTEGQPEKVFNGK